MGSNENRHSMLTEILGQEDMAVLRGMSKPLESTSATRETDLPGNKNGYYARQGNAYQDNANMMTARVFKKDDSFDFDDELLDHINKSNASCDDMDLDNIDVSDYLLLQQSPTNGSSSSSSGSGPNSNGSIGAGSSFGIDSGVGSVSQPRTPRDTHTPPTTQNNANIHPGNYNQHNGQSPAKSTKVLQPPNIPQQTREQKLQDLQAMAGLLPGPPQHTPSSNTTTATVNSSQAPACNKPNNVLNHKVPNYPNRVNPQQSSAPPVPVRQPESSRKPEVRQQIVQPTGQVPHHSPSAQPPYNSPCPPGQPREPTHPSNPMRDPRVQQGYSNMAHYPQGYYQQQIPPNHPHYQHLLRRNWVMQQQQQAYMQQQNYQMAQQAAQQHAAQQHAAQQAHQQRAAAQQQQYAASKQQPPGPQGMMSPISPAYASPSRAQPSPQRPSSNDPRVGPYMGYHNQHGPPPHPGNNPTSPANYITSNPTQQPHSQQQNSSPLHSNTQQNTISWGKPV